MLLVLLAGCAGSSGSGGSTNDGSGSVNFAPTAASTAAAAAASDASAGGSEAAGARVPTRLLNEAVAERTPGSQSYRIGPLDLLDITVFKVGDLTKVVQVGENGRIDFPLVGEVQAAGRTPNELGRDLARKLGENYLRNPQVSVLVKEYNSQKVTVDGVVRQPGVFPLQGGMNLVQAIAMARGIDTSLSDGTIIIFRTVEGRQAAARFNMRDVREGTVDNPQLVAGDVIMVPSSDAKEAFKSILSVVPVVNAFAWI
ncbi:polysaccharide biosynthesis/export family protein [Aquabacter cavernae]|uniref:polysaccharide biosynthesis/export family protein n=1 Tax=Aquabacter cavernae TaxID=2496029 RepID=UPI001FE10132|nr:polysaccharide biosynthesis/export family protein [Aquabacter cavernae]